MKSVLVTILLSSVPATLAGISYQSAYEAALSSDFSIIINPLSISMATTIGCTLMSLGNLLLARLKLSRFQGWYHMLINILSILSIVGPIHTNLPPEIKRPDLFPGLIAPLHLFPALFFITLSTFFKK